MVHCVYRDTVEPRGR